MKRHFSILILLSLVVSFPYGCDKKIYAAEIDSSSRVSKTVAVNFNPPFAFESNGKIVGMDVEIIDLVAKLSGWDLDYKVCSSVAETKDMVQNGKADFGIGGITIKSDREKDIDFSQPTFLEGGPQLMVNSGMIQLTWIDRLKIAIPILTTTLIIVFLVLSVFSHAIWILERLNGDEINFSSNYFKGIGQAYWWAIVTATTVGYGDITPKLAWGRLIAVMVMVAGIIGFASFTASITSTWTVISQARRDVTIDALRGEIIGTKAFSTSHDYLAAYPGITLQAYNAQQGGIQQACQDVVDGKIAGVVFDYPCLKRFSDGNPNCALVGSRIVKEQYGIMMPEDSSDTEWLNRNLILFREDGRYDKIYQKWFQTGN